VFDIAAAAADQEASRQHTNWCFCPIRRRLFTGVTVSPSDRHMDDQNRRNAGQDAATKGQVFRA
jgi:hypothetical protein